MGISRVFRYLSVLIILFLVIEYIDYFIFMLSYPHNIFLNEGFATRISLHFYTHGLAFGDLNTYPYFVTIYGFLYELVSMPLFYLMGPTVNIGRVTSFAGTLLIITGLIIILRKKNAGWFYIVFFSLIILFFKPMTLYTCLSKNDSFAALMTLVVLYSLYLHKGSKQFIITLLFSSFALMTKQTTVFIIPVVLGAWFINRENNPSFFKKSVLWVVSMILLFGVLFALIPNYYFNTITLSGLIGTITTSYRHLLINQVIPLLRGTMFFIIAACLILFKIRKTSRIKDILTPSFLYIIFYLPVFLFTSHSTGSMPVYYIFTFIGLSVFIPELILKYRNSFSVTVIDTLLLAQLLIFLLIPSKIDTLKFTYNKPTKNQIEEAKEIDSIVKENGIERSFVTFSRSSFGLSPQSAPNDFDFIHGYLLDKNKLNIEPYIQDFNNKEFSVIVGGLEYPRLKEAIEKNYYLYKIIGNTPIYLPRN